MSTDAHRLAFVCVQNAGRSQMAAAFAVAAPRESGALRVLLTSPGPRRHVVVGAACSRGLFVLGGVGLVGATTFLVGAVSDGPLGVNPWFVALAALLALSGVGIGTLVSTVAATQRWAFLGSVAVYLLLGVGWSAYFPWSPEWLLGAIAGEPLPTSVVQPLLLVAPGNAYLAGMSLTGERAYLETVASLLGAPVPSPAAAIAVLVGWAVVPVVAAAAWLERVDAS